MSSSKVLVVDDNATTRKLFRIALEAEGFAVVLAKTGTEALSAASDPGIEVVLMDCRLPDVPGPEVARRIRESRPALPVVAVTGWARTDDAQMLAGGFVEVLVKPVLPSRLVEVVRNYVGPAPSAPVKRGKIVLLVDDDPTQRKLMQVALLSSGFDVRAFDDGKSALAIAREHPPDILLSDVLMPQMDGFELCRAFREEPALQKTPIVLMSAHYLEDADRALGTRFGATGYVSRANGLDAVIREVETALEKRADVTAREPPWDLRNEYLQRVAHQLERQAALGAAFARRAALQSTAMSILGSISDALAGQINPESALDETLAQCLDAAGLSVGAILLLDETQKLALRSQIGAVSKSTWAEHAPIFEKALALGGLSVPSAEAGAEADALLAKARIAKAVVVPIVARSDAFGVLVLGSSREDFSEGDNESFLRAVRAVATQLGQALALSRLFSRLVAAEQRYRILFDNARDAISVLNPDGTILEMNQRWEEIAGVSRDRMIGHHIAEFLPEGQVETNLSMYRATVAQGGGSIPPTPIRRRDGTIAHVEFSSSVVEVDGQPLVLTIGRDVGERLRLAEQLLHAQKLEAVGRLAGGVAHDMNNMLSVVMTYSQFLESSLGLQDPRRQDAAEIRVAAERGSALTRQLLAFSRQQPIQPKILDLNEVVRGLKRMLQTLIGEDVELVVDLAAELPAVRVDAGTFEQVIMNLAVNARDAMPAGGRISIKTASSGTKLVLSVTDTGTGMDAKTLEHAFDPFFTTKTKGKGTGLGLSTVFGIVKQSGGDIEVDSAVGRGTTFRIYLPAISRAPAESPEPQSAPASGGKETIVVMEDEQALRRAIMRALKSFGYPVICEQSVESCLDACAAHLGPIHLLVTDVVLPTWSGPAIAQRLKTAHPEMKVLFMSGYTDTTAYEGVPVGGRAFLQKPFTPDALATRVREILDASD